MAGYGSLGGRNAHYSVFDRIQDTVFALASSLPCNSAAITELCQSLAGGGSSSFQELGGSGSRRRGDGGDRIVSEGGGASGTIKLNGRSVSVVKLLGEGGFSFVYLARDRESGREFALKKVGTEGFYHHAKSLLTTLTLPAQIRCPSGSEALPLALAELEAHRRFRSKYIMPLLDSAVVQDADGKTVYLFLPYAPMGNVQDYINKNLVLNRRWAEKALLEVFVGACEGVKAMHHYRMRGVEASRGASSNDSRQPQMTIPNAAEDAEDDEQRAARQNAPLLDTEDAIANGTHDDDDDPEGPFSDHAADEDASYPPRRKKEFEKRQPKPSGDDLAGAKGGDVVPYAHRDIKPGNIMLQQASSTAGDPNIQPMLMDFGSTCRARMHIQTRRQAITEQDVAAERSSMAYRAPELFDIKTDTTLTESVDIWSLGCTLYAMMYGYSPFETPAIMEQGGSVAMAVMMNNWKFPSGGQTDSYSEASRRIIQRCLVTKPEERADIDEVIRLARDALQRVS